MSRSMETANHSAIPSLDGIRAIAVSLVFFAHSGLEHIVPGGLGVTLFFVLSGYLISTLMRVEQAARGRIDYRSFYLRRFLRLMPPLLVVVAIAALLSATRVIDGEFSANGFLAVVFYFGNYFAIVGDFEGLPAGLGVVWSLAVEEHYYLFYPPLAALLLRVGRVGLSATILASLCGAVLTWRCWLAAHGVTADYLTMATDTRIDAILIGCLMALWRNPWLDPPQSNSSTLTEVKVVQSASRRLMIDAALVLVCLGVLLFTLLYRDEFFRVTFRHTLQSVAIAPLLYLAVARAQYAPFRWLSAAPLVYLGTISYTVYLSHHMILLMLAKHRPDWSWALTTCVAIALTLAIAEPMRRFIETPCARLRKRLHSARRTVGTVSHLTSPATPRGTL